MYYNESHGKSRWSVWGVKFKLFECITMNHSVSLDEVTEVSSLNCLNVLQWITG